MEKTGRTMNRFQKGDKICAQDGTPAGTAVEYLADGGLVIENVHGVRVVVKGDGAYKLYAPPSGSRVVGGKLSFTPIPITESARGCYGTPANKRVGRVLVDEFADSDAYAADVTDAAHLIAERESIPAVPTTGHGPGRQGTAWDQIQNAIAGWNAAMKDSADFKLRSGITSDRRLTIWKE